MLGGYGEWREKEASFLTNSERRKPERVRSAQAKYLKETKVRIKIKRKNMKIIQAIKCKNGWLITLTDHILAGCESDVLKVIKENGLTVREQFSHKPTGKNKNKTIYAD